MYCSGADIQWTRSWMYRLSLNCAEMRACTVLREEFFCFSFFQKKRAKKNGSQNRGSIRSGVSRTYEHDSIFIA